MKTKLVLLLMVATGVALISKGSVASASASKAAMYYGICKTVTNVSQYTCSCPGGQGTLSRTSITNSQACGTKRVFWVTPECDGVPGGCLDIDDRQETCAVFSCDNFNDADLDGWGPECCGGLDCNDSDNQVYPGAPPCCQGPGNDCNCNGQDDYNVECAAASCSSCPDDDYCNNNCYPNVSCSQGVCSDPTPILIDVQANGFEMTNAPGGAVFDVSGDGTTEHVAWPASDDAWLALDRNGNGKIDNGRELFGNGTEEKKENGFLVLAEFDRVSKGGNSDGQIDSRDSIFATLRLWQDSNHNGATEPGELHTLTEFGIAALELNYKESKRTDVHGNKFRYRAKVKDVHGAQVGRWAWDVIPVIVKQ